MVRYAVQGHADSLLPSDGWRLVWNDEFDGTELDRTKWDYRLHMMGKRHITWQDDGVTLDGNSNAVFRIYEKDGEICSSQLQTGYNFMDAPAPEKYTMEGLRWPVPPLRESLYLKKYGYFECRCRLQRQTGWWSAFWMQSPIIGASKHPETSGTELDIMESFSPGTCSRHAFHYGGYGVDRVSVSVGEGRKDLDRDAFHVFGMKWDKDGYTCYIDGVEDGHLGAPVSEVPSFLLISTEVRGYRSAEHRPTDEAVAAARAGDDFLVDYVRVFEAPAGC